MPKNKKKKERGDGMRRAAFKSQDKTTSLPRFPIQPPILPPGVMPKGKTAPVMAMDYCGNDYAYSSAQYALGYQAGLQGFPGYPFLAQLATRAEYRAFASGISTELTREWITVTSSETSGDGTKKKVIEIMQALEDFNVRQLIQMVAEHDSFYGAGQIFPDIKGADREAPLILDKRSVKQGSLLGFRAIEPMWTTPAGYNASDPAGDDFYRPKQWYMMGKLVNASRLLRVVTRPVPDIFKPAFNFGGISQSQLAEPTVNNWLRTRQSVADLVNNYSITTLSTDMTAVLQGEDDGEDLFSRAELFTNTRSNKGLMLLDKEKEEIGQTNTPLSTLDMLQAQAQEHMCAVSRQPAVVLTGIEPAGLNTNTEGTLGSWHAWVAAHQETYYRWLIRIIIALIQLHLYGDIDPDIGFIFNPLDQPTEKELAEIRKSDADAAAVYIDRNVIAADEEREKLAQSSTSGYHGLQLERDIVAENDDEETDDEEDSSSTTV